MGISLRKYQRNNDELLAVDIILIITMDNEKKSIKEQNQKNQKQKEKNKRRYKKKS